MAVATDNFNRADGNVGANWTATGTGLANLQIVSNQLKSAAGEYREGRYNAVSFGSNQYSQITKISGTSGVVNLQVRHTGAETTRNCYQGQISTDGSWTIYRRDAGVQTVLVTGSYALANNDVLRLEASGNLIRLMVNSSIIGSTTDATYTTGNPGIGINDSDLVFDNWEGGDTPSGILRPPLSMGALLQL